jgi:cytochrome P450
MQTQTPQTSTPNAARPPRFNPFVPGFSQDPYPQYRELRERNPVHRTLGMWVVTRYADVVGVLGDRSTSANTIPEEARLQAQKLGCTDMGAMQRLGQKSIVFTDNPDHARLRKLVARPFSPKACQERRPQMAAAIDRVIDECLERRDVDFVADLAAQIPLHIMADMMDLPAEVRPAISDWTHRIRFLLEPGLMTREVFADVQATLKEYMSFFRQVVSERRKKPGSDMISQLIEARAGEDALSEEEIIFSGIMTFVAGHETTKCLLGNGMLALLENPSEWQRLAQQPQLVANAVNEMFRYETPLQQTKRLATRDIVVGGQKIREGEVVLLCLGSANRDPAEFEDPDRFDIDRTNAGHIALGHGLHQCLGAVLARLEAQLTFEALAVRGIRVVPASASLRWLSHSFIIRGLERLPVVFST